MLGIGTVRRLRQALLFPWSILIVLVPLTACERSSPPRPSDEASSAPSARETVVTPSDPSKPNIIFILVDTLRADKVGAYHIKDGLTPTIDAIAEEGVVIERAIAQAPWTMPSIFSLFCSYNVAVHRLFSYTEVYASVRRRAHKQWLSNCRQPATPQREHITVVLDEQFQTLAEQLQAAGYATAGFVANPFVLAEYGFAQGFDHFDTSFADPYDLPSGDVVNQAAVAWLKQRDTTKPLFLYLHYMDVHGPYNAGPEFVDDLLDAVESAPIKHGLTPMERDRLAHLGKLPKNCPNPQRHRRLMRFREYWVARYESGIREFDHHLSDLRSSLSAVGLWDDAYVILTSDHGEALCEHGLWEHGISTHHNQLHVPLILRRPGVLPAGKWVSGTVRLMDMMPTLLEQLSLAVPEGVQGVSFVPLIGDQSPAQPLPAMAEGVKLGPAQRAFYQGDWKLMVTLDTGRRQLFNLYDDRLEQIDLSVRNPERVEILARALQAQVELNQRLSAGFEGREATLTPEQIEQLRSLGYIGD